MRLSIPVTAATAAVVALLSCGSCVDRAEAPPPRADAAQAADAGEGPTAEASPPPTTPETAGYPELVRLRKRAEAFRLAVLARKAVYDAHESRWSAPDRDRGLLLALSSVLTMHTIEGDATLREALIHLSLRKTDLEREGDYPEPPPYRARRIPGGGLRALGPQGDWLAVTGPNINLAGTSTYAPTTDDRIQRGRPAQSMYGQRTEPHASDYGLLAFDGTHIIEKKTGRTVSSIQPEWTVRDAVFDPSGQYLMTITGRVSMDSADSATYWYGSTFNVWAVDTGDRVAEFAFAMYGGIIEYAFDPTGRWVAIESGEEIFVMPIWPEDVVKEGCRMLTRSLDSTEIDALLTETSTTPGCALARDFGR